MNDQSLYKRTIIGFFVILIVSVLTFVSFVGENNKANMVVINFLKNVKNYDYERAGRELLPGAADYDKEQIAFADFAFLLELSLISKFDMLDVEDYQIDVKRRFFWLPWMPCDKLGMSVLFKKKDTNVFKSLSSFVEDAYIEDLFVLNRQNGSWRIVEINTGAASIETVFRKLKDMFHKKKYYMKTNDGFILDRFEYNNEDISPVERRLFKYALHKAILSIHESI